MSLKKRNGFKKDFADKLFQKYVVLLLLFLLLLLLLQLMLMLMFLLMLLLYPLNIAIVGFVKNNP